MEKTLFFDTGPIITLVLSRLAWILPELKNKFGGKFYITPAVRRELVERPITIKRFQFEALEVLKLIREGVLEVYENIPQAEIRQLINLANSSFKIGNKTVDIIQEGEIESLMSAFKTNSAIVIDERTLRLFVENSKEMEKLLEERFKSAVSADKVKISRFGAYFKDVTIIRSVELIGVAYKLGLLDSYIPKMKYGKETLLEGVLWAAKYNGSAVSVQEIEELQRFLR